VTPDSLSDSRVAVVMQFDVRSISFTPRLQPGDCSKLLDMKNRFNGFLS
jgi:hypothetical protein